MSSMRNAVQRRPHRERAQPLERRRLGLLEKHKDYSLRAADYNKKKKQLKNLRDKAEDRNEDEFYFGMMSRQGPGSRVKGGRDWQGTVAGDRGNKVMDMNTVRLLKTQDRGYVRTMRQVTAKKVAKLEQQVVMTRGMDHLDDDDEDEDEFDDDDDMMFDLPMKPKAPRKIVFMDDEDEREDAIEEAEEENEAQAAKSQKADDAGDGEETEQAKSLRRLKRELERERKKLKVLTEAERELEEQKAKMAKTATSGGETRRGNKIKVRARKR